MAFTPDQQRAIDAQGKVIVSASAGSGKTTVMIEKIIRLVQSGVDVGEILAVTFTKKAAAQMKEKLSKKLIETINEKELSKERRATLKKQLTEVPTADISTIHSFCAKLIRTHFFAAGVDNAFRVIGSDDAEGVALKNEALDGILEEGYESQEEDFAHLLSVYWRKKSDNALRRIFHELYEKLRIREDYKAYLELSAGQNEESFCAVTDELFALIKEKFAYYAGQVEREKEYFETAGAKAQTALCCELISWVNQLCGALDLFAAREIGKPKFTVNRLSKQDKENAEFVERSKRLGFLKERIVKAYEDAFSSLGDREEALALYLQASRTARALGKYLLRFDERYEELKKERGVLDYNDLEHKALALLADPAVAAEVREKYRYVFVDEYQDVNPVQDAIVSRLGGDNVFLVGDKKQSIYGFRGSQSKYFSGKQEEYAAGVGQSLSIQKNFRSASEILNAVNLQFAKVMTKENCDVDYKGTSMMEGGDRYDPYTGKVQVHFTGKDKAEEKKERGVYSVKEHAAKPSESLSRVTETILGILKSERGRKWFDPDTGKERALEYGDIAVLSRKKKGKIVETVAQLSDKGIPVSSAAAVNVCAFSEVKTLIDILSLIDNAEQDVPLCSALLSAMGNLTADELTKIRLAYPAEKTFRLACRRYADEGEGELCHKLKRFYAYYEKARLLSRVLDAGELLTRILAETKMEARLLSRENGAACLKRIRRFIDESVSPEPMSVHAFLERLRDLEYQIEYSESGGEDSVKVLTMHSSKGLEYPVVIVDGLSTSFHGIDRDEVYVEEKFGLAPRAYDVEKMTKKSTLLRALYEMKSEKSAVEDGLNLYYVALTRAKYALHLLFEEKTPFTDIKYARSYAELTDFKVWERYEAAALAGEMEKEERQALVLPSSERLTEKIAAALQWQYPFAGCENLPVKSSATHLLSKEALDERQIDGVADVGYGREIVTLGTLFDLDEEGQDGSAREQGIAYHAFLEDFDFSRLVTPSGAVDKETLLAIVKECLVGFGEQAKYLTAEKLTEILQNDVFYELQDCRLYKEQQFLVALPASETYVKFRGLPKSAATEAEQIIFQGAIDLLAVGDEVRIIDYKYSGKDAQGLLAQYTPQLQLYRMAVAKILQREEKSIRCTIVNIKRGISVDVE
ncbi:MAG: UvrD-helicase domain-containing protein [Clostridia bacterium]|nr:UvrD-helicase domain-containing protein [Clostridia bacterium]